MSLVIVVIKINVTGNYMHPFKCQQLQHKLNWCSGNCCEKTVAT